MLQVLLICLCITEVIWADYDWRGLDLVSAERKITPDGAEFILRYKVQQGRKARVVWKDAANDFAVLTPLEPTINVTCKNTLESHVMTAPSNFSYVIVSVGDNLNWISLDLMNTGSGDIVQSEFSVPDFSIDPGDRLVYKHKTNAAFTLTQDITRSNEESPMRMNTKIWYVDTKTGGFFTDYGFFTGFLDIMSSKSTHDDTTITARLNTMSYNIHGGLQFSLESLFPADFVRTIQIGMVLPFYPDTMQAPFDHDYLTFLSNSRNSKTKDGVEVIHCGRDGRMTCSVTCTIGGNDLENVTISKLMPNGDTQVETVTHATPAEFLLEAQIHISVLQTLPSVRYRCDAFNTQGHRTTKTYEVQFFNMVIIDEVASTATLFGDDANAGVDLQCVAKGSPDIDITFYVYYPGPGLMAVPMKPDTVNTEDKTVTATKALSLTGGVTAVWCIASQYEANAMVGYEGLDYGINMPAQK